MHSPRGRATHLGVLAEPLLRDPAPNAQSGHGDTSSDNLVGWHQLVPIVCLSRLLHSVLGPIMQILVLLSLSGDHVLPPLALHTHPLHPPANPPPENHTFLFYLKAG